MEDEQKKLCSLLKEKDLVVRKRMVNFLEKIFNYFDYTFDHQRYKRIIYSEEGVTIPLEEKMKNAYDGLMYLVHNIKTPITVAFLNRFFYLILGKELEQSKTLVIATKYFYLDHLPPIEKAIEFHLYIYQELYDLDEENRLMIALFFLNFTLIKNGLPNIQLFCKEIKEYCEVRKTFFDGDKNSMLLFILKLISSQVYQEKDFKNHLVTLDKRDVFNTINEKKEYLKKKYSIRSIWLYGSFAMNKMRYDSDIDLLVQFSQDLISEEKTKIIEEMKNYYFEVFHRYIDIHELDEYLTDSFITIASYCVKKIF